MRGRNALLALMIGLAASTIAGQFLAATYDRQYRAPVPGPDALSPASDPAIGTRVFVKQPHAAIVVVHTTCLGCSLDGSAVVRRLFAKKTLLNVVATDATAEYRQIQRDTPGARVAYVTPPQSLRLNPWFAPRVYAVSADGTLRYLQKNPNAKLDDEIQKASDCLR